MTRKVLILGYPGIQALDLFGPSEVFATASLALLGDGHREDGYDVTVVSLGGAPITTSSGLGIAPGPLPEPDESVDTLVLPGGMGVHAAQDDHDICGDDRAKAIQLSMEYDPQSPFDSGHLSKASAKTKATATALMAKDLAKPAQLQASTLLLWDRALSAARSRRR